MLEKVFHHPNQVCQTAKAPCSALQYVNLRRSSPIAVFTWGPWTYRLTFCVSLSPSRQITSEQDPRWEPGAVSKARFLRALNLKHNQIIFTGQPWLSCPRPENQITTSSRSSAWISGKPDIKSSMLKTRRLYLQHPQRVTCRGSACRTCCCLWDSLQCYSPPDGLTKCSWLFTLGLQKQPCQDLLNLNI